ncbi:MAG: tetratricopeptide repeat protein [Polyangiaceae bacterium]|nr:tetratricopeptide repeat protein [Polyangiaceae bacterium]
MVVRFLSRNKIRHNFPLSSLALLISLTVVAEAQDEDGSEAPAPAASETVESQPSPAPTATRVELTSDDVRRDPKGLKGISPFWEALNKGDASYIARDYGGANSHYQQAIVNEPKNATGHLRVAEVQLKLNDLDQAEEALVSALRFSGGSLDRKSRVFFLLAQLAEARAVESVKSLDAVQEGWRAYAALRSDANSFLVEAPESDPGDVPSSATRADADEAGSSDEAVSSEEPSAEDAASGSSGVVLTESEPAKGDSQTVVPSSSAVAPAAIEKSSPSLVHIYVGTAQERLLAAEARQQREEDYFAVRERIAERLREAEKAQR